MKGLRPVMLSHVLLMTFPMIMIMMLGQLSPNNTSAQLSANSTKTWLDREHNLKIVLSTTPVQPTAGTPSLLKFTVQNLETGKPIKNLLASVVILGVNSTRETNFQLTNIPVPDGNFSVNVIFSYAGLYQVITRIMSPTHTVAALASFIVAVTALQSASNSISADYIIWVSIPIAAAAGVTSFLILKRTMYKA